MFVCVKVLQERVETLTKQMQGLEGKAQSLQVTIDRLHSSLTKTEEEGHVSKDKVSHPLAFVTGWPRT
jgi:prefoldin subunit 5